MAENQQNQILDHTFNNGNSPIKLNQVNESVAQVDKSVIKMELSSLNRDVNKIQAHLKSLQIVDQEKKKFMNSSENFNSTNLFNATTQSKKISMTNNQKVNSISPYNYYGQSYRFQKNIDELRVDPPQILQRPKTQYDLKNSRNIEFDIKSQNNQKLSRIADTGLQDPLHYKFPNQNYYIYFQDKQGRNQAKPKLSFQPSKNQKLNNFSKKIQKQQKINNFDTMKKSGDFINGSQNTKSNWFLEKKITRMEKQLKQLKKKQQQRQKSNKFKNSKKNDSRININSQVERMINSLWP